MSYILRMTNDNKKLLSPDERNFLQKVSAATFSNPFSEDRERLDEEMSGVSSLGDLERVEAVTQRVTNHINALRTGRKADLRLYRGEDRRLIRNLFIFHVYHLFRVRFDEFILQQARSEAPCEVPFAREALGCLNDLGFGEHEGEILFAFFYQVRRAFYFINTGLVGSSRSMRQLRIDLWNQIFTHNLAWYEQYLWNRMEDFSTLLLGETGTGKGAAAAAIGRSGFIPFEPRRNCFTESFSRNFISLNLSQYPEALLESELFGHKKGAFTGAIENHDGVFSRCTPHGSIFLDEIGDVSIPVQIKLLQVLQERTFSPVGSHAKLRFNGRVIAATNRPLDELRRKGEFRDDFYYRLCSDIIHIPPLRDRLAEAPRELDLLVTHLLGRTMGGAVTEVVELVRKAIKRDLPEGYPWPGNVRELEQAVRQIILTGSYRPDQRHGGNDTREELLEGVMSGTLDAERLMGLYARLLHRQAGTYEEVARRLKLDRRTVKRYIMSDLE